MGYVELSQRIEKHKLWHEKEFNPFIEAEFNRLSLENKELSDKLINLSTSNKTLLNSLESGLQHSKINSNISLILASISLILIILLFIWNLYHA